MDKVCIIGAGSSGIVAAKVMQAHGIPFDCFEMGSDIGGNWRYNNDNGRSAAYDSLHIDTSKDRMQYSDFPMPDDYPVFPHHSQIFQYFQDYVAHFNLRPTITFRTQVTHVAPADGGGFHVSTRNLDNGDAGRTRYRAVLVCNGHHWQPKLPNFPGQFTGETMHSRNYRQPDVLRDKNVLVVGIGNSGVDIACEAATVARRTILSTRRGAHILPRYIFGRPIDKFVTPLSSKLPVAMQAFFLTQMVRLDRGPQEAFGIPRPAHKLYAAHSTVSTELPELVRNGRITMKPNVAQLEGDVVRFADGSREPIDVIVYATGYQIAFPFFDPDLVQADGNQLPLYRKVVHPEIADLYFIGLIQPLGPIMPLAELQAIWVARLLTGARTLPSSQAMRQAIKAEQAALKKRYVDSTRHTLQVDLFPYKRQLEAEIRGGKEQRPFLWLAAAAAGGWLLARWWRRRPLRRAPTPSTQ